MEKSVGQQRYERFLAALYGDQVWRFKAQFYPPWDELPLNVQAALDKAEQA